VTGLYARLVTTVHKNEMLDGETGNLLLIIDNDKKQQLPGSERKVNGYWTIRKEVAERNEQLHIWESVS